MCHLSALKMRRLGVVAVVGMLLVGYAATPLPSEPAELRSKHSEASPPDAGPRLEQGTEARPGSASVAARVVAGQPCPGGQIVVQGELSGSEPGAALQIGSTRGDLAVVDLPEHTHDSGTAIDVLAQVDGRVVEHHRLPVDLAPCPARVVAVAERVGATTVRVRTALLGTAKDNTTLYYDFGQGTVRATKARDVTFDYGPWAEGRRLLVSVATEADASNAPPGMVGYALVSFPRLDDLRATWAAIDARQAEQNDLARRLGWRNH